MEMTQAILAAPAAAARLFVPVELDWRGSLLDSIACRVVSSAPTAWVRSTPRSPGLGSEVAVAGSGESDVWVWFGSANLGF